MHSSSQIAKERPPRHLDSRTRHSSAPWERRLAIIMEMMREMSLHTDPQEMVRAYGDRIRHVLPSDRRISLSRRGLQWPQYRITRSSTWNQVINPWTEPDRLPLLSGGLLAELIYSNQPRIIDQLEVAESDPAFEYLSGNHSLLAIPMFDQGEALNMVVMLRRESTAFDREEFPEMVWISNLFGRATSNLVLSAQLKEAYQALDRELKVVGDIQRSLLPSELPEIPTLDLAAYYQPSRRAGGDYYDFFPLPDGRWGILIADVSGHGTPAAVIMAVTHAIAHHYPGPAIHPGSVLAHLNRQLASHYTSRNGGFVTAFYGVYDPATSTLTYANAGHHPPRLKRCQDDSLVEIDGAAGLPLGILDQVEYVENVQDLHVADQIIFYTDGITETLNGGGELFGTKRLDEVLAHCRQQAQPLLDAVLDAVNAFAEGRPADDDRTLIVARVHG